MLQEASTKNQVYQSTFRTMQSFLDKLPAEQIDGADDLAQVAAKQKAQEVRTLVLLLQCLTAPLESEEMQVLSDERVFPSAPQRVMEDLKRKADDMDRVSDLSLDLQKLLNVRREAAAASRRQHSQQA